MKISRKNIEKFLFEPFVAAWIFFGTIMFIYAIISQFTSGGYYDFNAIDWVKHIILMLIFSLYPFAYFKRKARKNLNNGT